MATSYLNDADAPRGISNNNPGNIKMSSANDWKGQVATTRNIDGTFEQFQEMRWGLRALMVLLRNYINSGNNTITQIIQRWAPTGNNPTKNFIDYVANQTGFNPTQSIAPTKEPVTKIAWAIVQFENGSVKGYITKQDVRDAYSLVRNPDKEQQGISTNVKLIGAGLLLIGIGKSRIWEN